MVKTPIYGDEFGFTNEKNGIRGVELGFRNEKNRIYARKSGFPDGKNEIRGVESGFRNGKNRIYGRKSHFPDGGSPIYDRKQHNNHLKTTNHETDYPFTHRIHRRKPHRLHGKRHRNQRNTQPQRIYFHSHRRRGNCLLHTKRHLLVPHRRGAFECEGALKAGDIRFKTDGVSKLKIKDLHCDNIEIEIDGVGKANVNVYCDHLKARVDGVSSLKLSGKARTANLHDSFLGKIDNRRLKVGEYFTTDYTD